MPKPRGAPDALKSAAKVLAGKKKKAAAPKGEIKKFPNIPEHRLPKKLETREELIYLLNQACELEHGLACAYLYAAFSLKQDLSEGCMTWRQQEMVRKWAAQLYFVASQEMLHLAQACNLLTAVGAAPHFQRPNFPVRAKYYPMGLKLTLSPFTVETLDAFIRFELPDPSLEKKREEATKKGKTVKLAVPAPVNYDTVGHLYGLIANAFDTIPAEELFIGPREAQMTRELVEFPNIVPVYDRESALRAIDLILVEGEGTQNDTLDCHYGVFLGIREQYLAAMKEAKGAGEKFDPVRPIATNPCSIVQPDTLGDEGSLVTNAYTKDVLDLFNSVYQIMLLMLYRLFAHTDETDEELRRLSDVSITLMPIVVKPLAEALTFLPATEDEKGVRAGPSFEVYSTMQLLPHRDAAWKIFREQFKGAIRDCRDALDNVGKAPAATREMVRERLQSALRNLERLDAALRGEVRLDARGRGGDPSRRIAPQGPPASAPPARREM
jgi:hypothetical protein